MYKVGDKVKLKNERGAFWNVHGEMDEWMGKTVTIRTVYDSSFDIVGDDEQWSFGFDDIERLVGYECDELGKVIYNKTATVVKWEHGDKTIVSATDGDAFDPKYGYLLAYFQKNSGLSKTQANKFIDGLQDLSDEYAKKQAKKDARKK